MTKNATFIDWLETELQARGWSRAKLARQAKISDSTLSHICKGVRAPGADVCSAIAGAMGISERIVFEAAGLLQPDTGEEVSARARQLFDLAKKAGDDDIDLAIAMLGAAVRRREERARQ